VRRGLITLGLAGREPGSRCSRLRGRVAAARARCDVGLPVDGQRLQHDAHEREGHGQEHVRPELRPRVDDRRAEQPRRSAVEPGHGVVRGDERRPRRHRLDEHAAPDVVSDPLPVALLVRQQPRECSLQPGLGRACAAARRAASPGHELGRGGRRRERRLQHLRLSRPGAGHGSRLSEGRARGRGAHADHAGGRAGRSVRQRRAHGLVGVRSRPGQDRVRPQRRQRRGGHHRRAPVDEPERAAGSQGHELLPAPGRSERRLPLDEYALPQAARAGELHGRPGRQRDGRARRCERIGAAQGLRRVPVYDRSGRPDQHRYGRSRQRVDEDLQRDRARHDGAGADRELERRSTSRPRTAPATSRRRPSR